MKASRLLIARHGNTFRPGETPTRVGGRTDLDLVESEKGRKLGKYLVDHDLLPDRIISSPLKRCLQTAELVVEQLPDFRGNIELDADFAEIDYGPDENKTEEEVERRLGRAFFTQNDIDISGLTDEQVLAKGKGLIDLWNQQAVVPEGWKVDVDQLIKHWISLAASVKAAETVLMITSNGVIRFAPHITGDFEGFTNEFNIKVGTGSLCVFERDENGKWRCVNWGIKP